MDLREFILRRVETAKSMKEITEDPRWLDAQGQFLNASQFFAVDPLVL